MSAAPAARTWFYVTIATEHGPLAVAIEARDEQHARQRAERGGHTVAGARVLPSVSVLWLSVSQSFPLRAGKVAP